MLSQFLTERAAASYSYLENPSEMSQFHNFLSVQRMLAAGNLHQHLEVFILLYKLGLILGRAFLHTEEAHLNAGCVKLIP